MSTTSRFIGLCAALCSLFTTLPQLVKAQCRGKIIYEGDLNEPPATANSCANPEDLLFQEWQIKNVSSDNIVNNYYTIRLIEKNGVDRTSDFLQYYTPSDASGNTIPNHPSPNLAPWQTGVHLPVYFKFAPPEGGLYEIFYVRHDGVQCGTLRGGLSTKVYICQGAVNPPELKLKSPNCISFVPAVGTDFFGDVPIQFSATLVNPTSRTFSVPLAEARIRPRNAQSVGTIIATIANKQLAPNATLTLKATQLPLPVSDLGEYEIYIQYRKRGEMVQVENPDNCPYPKIIQVVSPDLPDGATRPKLVSPGRSSATNGGITIKTLVPKLLWRNIRTSVSVIDSIQKLVIDENIPNDAGTWQLAHVSPPIVRSAQLPYGNQYALSINILEKDTKYRWWATSRNNDNSIAASDTLYFKTGNEEEEDCTPTDPATTSILKTAAVFLCDANIVKPKPEQNNVNNPRSVRPTKHILRADLAAICAKGLFGGGTLAEEPIYTDNYNVPYDDLADNYVNYFRYPKMLAYWKYKDDETPFDNEQSEFNPWDSIRIKHALKVMMESFFDMDAYVSATLPNNILISRTDSMFKYVDLAKQKGVLRDFLTAGFNADAYMKRDMAFVILYRILKLAANQRPTLADLRNPNYYESHTFMAKHGRSQHPAMGQGNFQHYESASFSIPDVKSNLSFAHSYESNSLFLPQAWYPYFPLGRGWTHSNHSYIKFFDKGKEHYDNILDFDGDVYISKQRYLIFFQGSVMPDWWEVQPNGIKAVTEGANLSYSFNKINANKIELRMLNLTVLTFEKFAGGDPNVFWLTSVQDRNNNITTLEYQSFQLPSGNSSVPSHRLHKVKPPSRNRFPNGTDRELLLEYSSARPQQLIKVTGPGGVPSEPAFKRTIEFSCTNDSLKTYLNLEAKRTEYTYNRISGNKEVNKKYLLKKILLPKGNYIDNQYQGRRLQASTTFKQDGTPSSKISVEQTRDDVGRDLSIVKDINNNTLSKTLYTSDGQATQSESLQQDGSMLRTEIDYMDRDGLKHLPEAYTENGMRYQLNYNDKGQITERIADEGNENWTERWTYEDYFLKTHTNARGYTTTIDYLDNTKKVDKITGFDGAETKFYYDHVMPDGTRPGDWGLVTGVRLPVGKRYSDNGVSSLDAAFLGFQMQYNKFGNPTKTLALGTLDAPLTTPIVTQTQYDNASRPAKVINPLSEELDYTYYENDLIQKVTHPRSVNGARLFSSYTYDDNENLTGITNTNGKTTTLGYSFNDDYLTSMRFGNDESQYRYDNQGRLEYFKKPRDANFTRIQYHNNGLVRDDGYFTYEYGSTSNPANAYTKDLLRVVNDKSDVNNKITYTYDKWKRVISYTIHFPTAVQGSYTIEYEYVTHSHLIDKMYFTNSSVTRKLIADYSYDAADRQITAKDANLNVYHLYRRWDGSPDRLTYRAANATAASPNIHKVWDYDNQNRVQKIGIYTHNDRSLAHTIAEYNFTMDNVGFHTEVDYREPIATPASSPVTQNFGHTDENRLQSLNGSNVYGFDANGNQNQHNTYHNFRFHDRGQLEQIGKIDNTYNADFYYNVMGLRCAATRNGVSTRYAHDITGIGNVVVEMDAQNVPQYYYLNAFNEGMLSRIKADNSETRVFHHDVRGSTIAMTDFNGVYKQVFAYDVYGKVADKWTAPNEVETRYTYVGAYGVEAEDGNLYYMRARYYDAGAMRFISQDPIWAENLYAYAGNNSTMKIDKNGQESILCIENSIIGFPTGHTWLGLYVAGTKTTYGLHPIWPLAPATGNVVNGLYKNAEIGRAMTSKKCTPLNEKQLKEFDKAITSVNTHYTPMNVCTDFTLNVFNKFAQEKINLDYQIKRPGNLQAVLKPKATTSESFWNTNFDSETIHFFSQKYGMEILSW